MKGELRQAIDTIPGLVWSALPDGHVDFLNKRWCDYTGMSMDNASAEGWHATIHLEDRPGLLTYWCFSSYGQTSSRQIDFRLPLVV